MLRRLEDEVDKAYSTVLFYELLNQIMKEPQEDWCTFQARIFCGRAFKYLLKRLRDAGFVCETGAPPGNLYEDELSCYRHNDIGDERWCLHYNPKQ